MRRIINSFTTPAAITTIFFYTGSFALNVLRYFFHLVLLRILTPPEYGEFLSYLSLTYLLGIPMGTISSVVTRFVAQYRGKNDAVAINLFFYYLIEKISPITFGIGLLLICLSAPLAGLFKAHSAAFVVLGVSVMLNLYQSIIGSYLAAFQHFLYQTLLGFLSVVITIILSIAFIKMGLSATGAVLGQLLAGVIISLATFLYIKDSIVPKIKTKKMPHFSLSGFTGYSFIYALGTMSLISTDILVVRALYDSHTSGLYSALSILGRMILFGLTPLIGLVLPMATHRHSATGSARSLLMKLGLLTAFLGVIGAGLFSFFPNLTVKLLSGPQYLEAARLLPFFAFSMVFFALSQFLLSYLMAIGRPQVNYALLIATLLQPAVIYLFRNTISGAVISQFFLFLILFFCLLVYTVMLEKTTSE